jgi:hypothetical protein
LRTSFFSTHLFYISSVRASVRVSIINTVIAAISFQVCIKDSRKKLLLPNNTTSCALRNHWFLLARKDEEGVEVYIYIERAIFGSLKGEEFTVRVAANVKEACELIEPGFEYVTDMDSVKLFRKLK